MSVNSFSHNQNLFRELTKHGTHHTTAHTKLDTIAANTFVKHADQVKSTSAGIAGIIGGEEAPIADDNGREGWGFNKIAVGSNKFNWYFYGAGNTLTTIGDLKSISCILSVDSYTATNSLPFFVVYSKPTGVGDASWYKSSITYQLSAGEKIHLGEEIQAWSGVKPTKQSNRRMVEFNAVSTNTLGVDTSIEELYSIAVHSDSGAGVGTKMLVKQVGFDLYTGDNKIERRINLII
tara:strand:- start:1000 stop:1704 length:705 start_codon:yes stop_codon:yes gene_type:complete